MHILHKVKQFIAATFFKESRNSRTGLSSFTFSKDLVKDTEGEGIDLRSKSENIGYGGNLSICGFGQL